MIKTFLSVWSWFYLIPTPILAKTSRSASAAAATIQIMLYNGFSNKRAGIIKQYNISLLRTAIFILRNSSLLQCIAELLQGASTKIIATEIISSTIAVDSVEDCSQLIRYKQAYSQNKEVIKQENTVGICSPFVFSRKNANPKFKRITCGNGAAYYLCRDNFSTCSL